MKIKVEKIRDKEIEVEEEISASTWEMHSSDVTFVDSIYLKCKFSRVRDEIKAQILVTTHRDVVCSRCSQQVRHVVEQSFIKNYKDSKVGEWLEINDDIREEILLNFPMKVLCKEDCKGKCSGCGIDLNSQECDCQ
ncbi:MAG: DUF177 domain-containing protein [Candidatus Omnitrophica bacterium]|nr:DUF177 domain-containing protein [Candidatus Omnitrophota bacterium]